MSGRTIPIQLDAARHGDPSLRWLKPGALRLDALPPLSLYIHFPWCVRKCPYCDFNSHEAGSEGIPESAYLDALKTDLELALPSVWGRRVHSVFIGGGTPSLLSAAGLDRLLADVRSLLPIDADAEITLEANPGTFEAAKFKSYRASGVNRLSIGIQSFNDRCLQSLGRIHDGDEARRAIDIAAASFDNFNLDLMYALPAQTLAECAADIDTALRFAPTHLSIYQLTMEPNTVFAKYPPVVPDDDAMFAMHELIDERLAAAGFTHYEVSAYAQPGHMSRHNLNYWMFGDYLGIGAGAHSKLSFAERIVRQTRFQQPRSYLDACAAAAPLSSEQEVPVGELGFEFVLNALRLRAGVASSLFSERTGLPITVIQAPLARAIEKGLLDDDPTVIKPTPLGARFLNDLQALFLSA